MQRFIVFLLFYCLFDNSEASGTSTPVENPIEFIKTHKMDTLLIGGIGEMGKKDHLFWRTAEKNEFVINVDPEAGPHMLADGFNKDSKNFNLVKKGGTTSIPLKFFSEKELEELKEAQQIKKVFYERVGRGLEREAIPTVKVFADLLNKGGKFEYSSFWQALQEDKVPFNDTIAYVVREKNSRYGDPLASKNAMEKKKFLKLFDQLRVFMWKKGGNRKYFDSVEHMYENMLSLKRSKEEELSKHRKDRLEGVECFLELQKEIEEKWGQNLKTSNKQDESEFFLLVKALWENVLDEEEWSTFFMNPSESTPGFNDFLSHAKEWKFNTDTSYLELKPFTEHKNHFPEQKGMREYYELLTKELGLGEVQFYIDRKQGRNTIYSFRMTGVKGAPFEEEPWKTKIGPVIRERSEKPLLVKEVLEQKEKKLSSGVTKPAAVTESLVSWDFLYQKKTDEIFSIYTKEMFKTVKGDKSFSQLEDYNESQVKEDIHKALECAVEEYEKVCSKDLEPSQATLKKALWMQEIHLALYRLSKRIDEPEDK